MVRPICKDAFFLRQKAVPAVPADAAVGQDLLDTLRAHAESCVGLAANMIGVNKAIIAVNTGLGLLLMFNPVILRRVGPYADEEGCLSLTGTRSTTRYDEIETEYFDAAWRRQRQTFRGQIAQIIQHETDHLNGILI